ncbi:adenosylcobinamide-GDP ribazoletransferase [Prosthecochloris sp. N3]|uniref:Adenosylcobinamide-GDP ribazoletransferase n=1 Tax=Prosthecochloris ethylica TaxID=2743976 RepID=A0ABR9XUE4_9CHLB|nr:MULTISPECIES: adenosylcobinamide-GDP ribazoletransferase [Prosthecochloris]MBF0587270.1 adenosylcobinamide-GDP ribazoletransferase [Prosthecochloris ethylica]MBF0637508.1 adenosylcobinamide-GDP ribazoletransferase [Prosthecochloris ethylica]NUK48078.1 adenosylcobinamide-GDP ribazoletransferase [Prosthecochloris ethylica]RNA66098.1 adenosylcobinamide-GDP ribazoletransferase [Prosthecochloris sp. ZM_2]RNA66377.1 adenosylcobinamide-GDP ribazoletransferase [Prosthecochloris sp. ZM_2]
MFNGLVTSLRTLTVLPVPGRDAHDFSDSLYWFPLAGLLLGLLQAVCGWAVVHAGLTELAAAAVLMSAVLLTRAIHADGLADLADGFFGGRDVDARLRIMKDSSVGAFGVLALVLVLLAKWAVLLPLLESSAYTWIVSGVILARSSQVLLASLMPYARSGGGTASGFVRGAGGVHAIVSLLLSSILLFILFSSSIVPVLLAQAVALAVTSAMALLSMKKINGVTGDVLGASSEVTELAVWCAGAMFFQLV